VSQPYRFGIEEEYFLADAATRGTPDAAVLERFHARATSSVPRVERELLATQVEGSTPPSADFAEARQVLAGIRAGLAEAAREEGLLVLASGTHPLASWTRQSTTEKERYQDIAAELRLPGRRNVISGLHVHVEVARPEGRVELMNRLLPFLPLLLALSASSPFWQGLPTGLAAYRLCVFGEMPRTGLPEVFASGAEYDRFVGVMTRAGAIPDPSYVWWAVRPSLRYPTLELRIADSCTRLEDAVAIAALWRCLVRLAERRPELNAGLGGGGARRRQREPLARPARRHPGRADRCSDRRRGARGHAAGGAAGAGRRGCRGARLPRRGRGCAADRRGRDQRGPPDGAVRGGEDPRRLGARRGLRGGGLAGEDDGGRLTVRPPSPPAPAPRRPGTCRE
jgi:carboxylate-amine ligase